MKTKMLCKLKQNRAFTLIETLMVVGVVLVLLGLSILGITNLMTNLKMTELDERAKTIYLEAQNQLSVLEIEGGLGAFHKNIRESYPAGHISEELRFLKEIYPEAEKPSDYPEGADKMWEQMCYLKKNDTLSAKLISYTSDIYNDAGSYLIEFNAQTGDIYGVFCWESDEELTYNDILNLENRTREKRTEARIGYYGGAVSGDLTAGETLGQTVSLINGEELYLKISYKNTEDILNFYDTALNITVTITGEKGNSVVIDRMDLSNVVFTLDTIEFYMLLDSMQEGKHFEDIVNAGLSDDKKIIPGENIEICVDSYFAHESGRWETTESIVGNSLFGYGTDENKICISSLRHILNLNKQYYDDTTFGRTTIQYIKDVDFEEEAYAWGEDTFGNPIYKGYGNAERPITHMEPIENDTLFEGCTVNGAYATTKYVLHNFNIVATKDNAGIFGTTKDVDFSNIYVKDINVEATGYDNVGAFIGYMEGGTINDCGVYLSTSGIVNGVETEFCKMNDSVGGCSHQNEMEHRYDTYRIKGNNNVGGLIGYAEGVSGVETNLNLAFAAIKVEGSGTNVGGLVGRVRNVAGNKNFHITNSYASGDVFGDEYVGGFIGTVSASSKNVVVSENYATGKVYADRYFGGFLGKSQSALYKDCISYGEIFKTSVLTTGIDRLEVADCVGGFVYKNESTQDTYTNCVYMTQNGYNTEEALQNPSVIGKKTYNDLLSNNTGTAVSAYPYNVDLYLQGFPFKVLTGQSTHYGDWPKPFVIDTSLVYFERYEDTSYGYYCVTTISENNNFWVLNTLKDKPCVEDGYGLLTKYNLKELDYNLYVGNEGTGMDGLTPTISKTGVEVVTKSQMEGGASVTDKFIRLNHQGDLQFYAVEGYDEVLGKEGARTGESFEVSNLYLYQLPYELQCTDRMNVSYFYDRIQFTAIAYGSNTKVVDGLSYLYCPHFAKTAVNPNVNEVDVVVDYEAAHQNPTNIFIRSARQLNALGRYPYYWNERGGLVGGEKVTYIQETDINFSTYVKTYCGQEFDLQTFGKIYSNRPIGDPDLPPDDSQYYNAQFRNTYDGRSNKIIDYCVDGSWIDASGKRNPTQFTGLFGEINDATLKNIVMVVSSNPKGNGGLISASYRIDGTNGQRPWESKCTKRAGVGALVGLAYETSTTSNTITNCVASGYTVRYKLLSEASLKELNYDLTSGNSSDPLGIAIGGLVGFSMSDMSNCAASNRVVMDMEANYVYDGQGTVFIGGFAGSYFYGKMTDCYSGGTVEFEDNNADDSTFAYGIARLRASNFCPGWMDTPASGKSYSSGTVFYERIYSTTELSDVVWTIREKENNSGKYFTHYIPLVSRMVVVENSSIGDVFDRLFNGKSWTTDMITGTTDVRAVDTYYMQEVTKVHLNKVPGGNSDAPKKYYNENGGWFTTYNGPMAEASTLTKLEGFTNGYHKAAFTYINGDLDENGNFIFASKNYPYPEVIYEVDENGIATDTYVHYGEWVMMPTEDSPIARYPAYYEEYEDGYGFWYVDENGITHSNLAEVNTTPIKNAGYGYLTMFRKEANKDANKAKIVIANTTYYLCEMDQTKLEEAHVSAGREHYRYMQFEMAYTRGEVSIGTGYELALATRTISFNPYYGAALCASENLGTEANPLQVRTKEQFENVAHTSYENAYIKQTHDVDLTGGHTPAVVNAGIVYDGSSEKGCVIKNATDTLFEKNDGTIKNTKLTSFDSTKQSSYEVAGFIMVNNERIENCSIVAINNNDKVVIQGKTAYGFAKVNHERAIIESCYVIGDVIAIENDVYGFVGINEGRIYNSHVGDVDSDIDVLVQGAKAYGFVEANNEKALIENCYVKGKVIATKNVATGFVGVNNGRIGNSHVRATNSYDDVVIQGTNAYGFVVTNNNVITESFVVGTVTGTNLAVGFVYENMRTIEKCYANTIVSASIDNTQAKASGFALLNSNVISNAYACGEVSAYTTYGFLENGNANACYTIVNQTGTNMYGFSANGTPSGCYWGYDGYKNHNVPVAQKEYLSGGKKESVITGITLAVMDNAATDSKAYPFAENLKNNEYLYETFGLTHYGDWPLAAHFYQDVNAKDWLRAGVYYGEEYVNAVTGETYCGVYAIGDYFYRPDENVENVGYRVIGATINTLMKGDSEDVRESNGYRCYYGVYYNKEVSASGWKVNWKFIEAGIESEVKTPAPNGIFGNLTEGYVPPQFTSYRFCELKEITEAAKNGTDIKVAATIFYVTTTNNNQNTDTNYDYGKFFYEDGTKIDATNGVELTITLDDVEAARKEKTSN